MLFLMSTLTWITGKELERVIKTRRRISLEEKHETFIVDFIAAVRKWEMLAASKEKMSSSKTNKSEQEHKKQNFWWAPYDNSPIKIMCN